MLSYTHHEQSIAKFEAKVLITDTLQVQAASILHFELVIQNNVLISLFGECVVFILFLLKM